VAVREPVPRERPAVGPAAGEQRGHDVERVAHRAARAPGQPRQVDERRLAVRAPRDGRGRGARGEPVREREGDDRVGVIGVVGAGEGRGEMPAGRRRAS
jgi:hypothetical protein